MTAGLNRIQFPELATCACWTVVAGALESIPTVFSGKFRGGTGKTEGSRAASAGLPWPSSGHPSGEARKHCIYIVMRYKCQVLPLEYIS
jgi:hypothetical protein